MTRIDMSEYMERHSVSRLIGAPPGYVGYDEGGLLTESVRRRPYQLVLLDEIEKASREVTNILLQVMDEGFLTDAQGHRVDFRNTVIIMTSNLGAMYDLKKDGDVLGDDEESIREEEMKTREVSMDAVRRHFAPEFVNRIDDIIVFGRLRMDNMRPICDIQMKNLQHLINAEGRNITLNVSDAAKDWLSQMGFSKQYGARPLKRCIQNLLMKPLSFEILSGNIKDSSIVNVDYDFDGDKLKFDIHNLDEAEIEKQKQIE